jgi:hypothetical protein
MNSMLGTVRGKGAGRGAGGVVSKPAAPLPIRQFLPEHSMDSTIKAPAPKAAGALVHPAHCCVYCGHLVYTPPRAVTIRCPMCAHELPVEDILLSGTVTDPEVITCGKIVVVENTLVRGNLIACTIDVAGSVCGDIVASHLCTLRPTARHVGRLLSRNLNLQEGAVVESYIELIRD